MAGFSHGMVMAGLANLDEVPAAGGAATPLLVLAAAPADQPLSSGSTASAAITFGTPTGGSGTYSYAATLDKVGGAAGASMSGSGAGPYTVSGLSDGDLTAVRMTITDTVTGQTADQAVVVGVATAAGVSLENYLDFSGVTYDFLTTGGTGGSGGEGPHTVNGHSVELSYNGGGAPDVCRIVDGEFEIDNDTAQERTVLFFDLGEDVSQDVVLAYWAFQAEQPSESYNCLLMVSESGNTGSYPNQNGRYQVLCGDKLYAPAGANDTAFGARIADSASTFRNISADVAVLDLTANPLRIALRIDGAGVHGTWDQASTALPTDGKELANDFPEFMVDQGGTITPANSQYLIWDVYRNNVTGRLKAQKGVLG